MRSEKRFKLSDWCGEQSVSNVIDIAKQTHLTNIEVLDLLNGLNDENQKLIEIITEMKDIIYMLQDLRIGDYSSEIEEDMQELKKAYDGNLEDFLKYFRED